MVAELADLPGIKGLYQVTFKMTFQIVNVATPKSVHNTCVLSIFAAGDSVTNLHVAFDHFRGPDRTATWKCVLTTSAVSRQAVLEKMHKSSLTVSQYLFLTSPFHR